MKNLKVTAGIVLTGLVLCCTVSCKKDFYTKVNNNPNAPANVAPGTLLTPIEVTLAYTQGGDLSRFASMFVQQTSGISRQCAAYYQYIITNQDIEYPWDNLYTAVMENDYTLMNQIAGKDLEYKGITEIIMAYNIQLLVDTWGYVPYSQALLGAGNTHPSYDKDVTLYANAMQLCSQGITDINNATNDVDVPGPDDVIYNGSGAEWIKFAHAIKARLYIHQSQTNGGSVAMADSALAEVGRSFTSNADNAQVVFGNAATSNAPWYQFYTQRGDISYEFDPTFSVPGYFASLLTSLNDPRKPILIDSVNESQFNYLNSYYQLANSPVEFICYDELQFIGAEATLRSGGTVAAAQTFYQNAITANMQKLSSNPAVGTVSGAQITSYLLAHGTLSLLSKDSALAEIAQQEYIALYLNPEAWTLWRRTTSASSPLTGFPMGSPALTPVAGPFQANGVPRRYLYPQSELNLNGANTPSATQWSPKVFWDN